MKIRKFLICNLKEVMKIEKASFPDPWPEIYFKKLYKKLGFRIIKIVKNYYRNGDNVYLMRKEI